MKLSHRGRSQSLGAGVDVLLTGGDHDVADAPIRVADGQRNFGVVAAEQQVAERDIGRIVGALASTSSLTGIFGGGEGRRSR